MKTLIHTIGVVTVMIAAVTFLGCSKKTDTDHAGHDHAAQAQTAVDAVEQTICPVMKAPINKEIFVEYEGKKVYFCCPGCPEEFKKNPEKYLPDLPQFKK